MYNHDDFENTYGILSDQHIEYLSLNKNMISPFHPKMAETGVISYGLSSYGYDARCSDEFKVFTNAKSAILDPKNFNPDSFVDIKGDHCIVPPNGFALTNTIERFDIPQDVMAICLGKSTYARIGIIINVTPLEAGWTGQVTIEISNTTSLPAKIYSNEGICQFLFLRGETNCRVPYNARLGKYMHQSGITLPKCKS